MRNATIRKGAVPSDAFRNPVLENISVAAFQADTDFVAKQIFPTIPCDEQQVKYYEIDMDTIAQNKAQVRAPGTAAEEGAWALSQKTVLCEAFGYREKLPEELIQSAGTQAANAEQTSAASVAEVMNINEDSRWAAAFFKTGVWARDMVGQSTADSTHYIFWDTATGVPLTNLLTERTTMKKTGKRWANTLVLGAEVVTPLLTNAQVIARVVNGQRPGMSAEATLDDIAKLCKVDRVIVAGGVQNTAAEGVAGTNGFIFNSKSAWLGYVNPSPSVNAPSAGYRFTWKGIAGNDQGYRTWRYWQQDIRSFWIEAAIDDTFKSVSTKLGMFFSNIVQ